MNRTVKIATAALGLWAVLASAAPAFSDVVMLVCLNEGRNGSWLHIRTYAQYSACEQDQRDHFRRFGHNVSCTVRPNTPQGMRGIIFE